MRVWHAVPSLRIADACMLRWVAVCVWLGTGGLLSRMFVLLLLVLHAEAHERGQLPRGCAQVNADGGWMRVKGGIPKSWLQLLCC